MLKYYILLLLVCVATASQSKYMVDASWFANRYSLNEWNRDLEQFQNLGGSIVWQRGNFFRERSVRDIETDPDFVWAYFDDHCTDKAIAVAKQLGVTIVNWFTYQNDERYDNKSMIRCPNLDYYYNYSRIYYRMIVPHEYTPNWNCQLTKGQKVDVIFTEFAGTDPHELLMTAAQRLGMDVYLPMPTIPIYLPSYSDHLGPFYEFSRRVLDDYSYRYGGMPAYKGVYQNNEACTCDWYADYLGPNKMLSNMAHARGKLYVSSPYIDLLKDQCVSTVEQHKQGFKALARAGLDIIAVQEGRGTGHGPYAWNFQTNYTIVDVDPLLYKIVNYVTNRDKKTRISDAYMGTIQQVFKAFDDAVVELKSENINVEFWLNIEAFEYTRANPCLNVDKTGNGMAEILDRTIKSRLDWSLTVAGSYPNKIISFAWDCNYLCIPSGYTTSLADDVASDVSRPIVSFMDANTGLIRGYNLMSDGRVQTDFNVICASGKTYTKVQAASGDDHYGIKNGRHAMLQQVLVPDLKTLCPSSDDHVCIYAHNFVTDTTSYHEYCYEK